MHDARDGGLTYEDITILRDLKTRSGLSLTKGTCFETVYLVFSASMFEFINWKPKSEKESNHLIPNKEMKIGENTGRIYPASINIPQRELAPFIHWNDKDEEYPRYRKAFGLPPLPKKY